MDDLRRLLELVHTDKTTDEQAVCEAAFRGILDGEPTDQAALVAATDLPPERVRTVFEVLTERGLIVSDPTSGQIVGSWGLSSVQTRHRLRIRGRELYAWCALDAVGIPAALSDEATITSTCHQCGSVIYLEVTDGSVTQADPADVWIWLSPCEVGRSVVGFT